MQGSNYISLDKKCGGLRQFSLKKIVNLIFQDHWMNPLFSCSIAIVIVVILHSLKDVNWGSKYKPKKSGIFNIFHMKYYQNICL